MLLAMTFSVLAAPVAPIPFWFLILLLPCLLAKPILGFGALFGFVGFRFTHPNLRHGWFYASVVTIPLVSSIVMVLAICDRQVIYRKPTGIARRFSAN